MAGQGRPTTLTHSRSSAATRTIAPVLRACLTWPVWICFLFCGTGEHNLTGAEPTTEAVARPTIEPVELRLRISLGGGTPRRWQGQISITDEAAQFQSLAPLGLNQPANAAIQLRDNIVTIEHTTPTDYNAIDVTIQGSLNADLVVDLSNPDDDTSQASYTVRLLDVMRQANIHSLDSQGNGCSIERVPGDLLRVELDRPHLIFRPGEPFVFSLAPNLTPFQSTTLNCRLQITDAGPTSNSAGGNEAGETILSRKYFATSTDVSGSAEPAALTIPVPAEEGVYNLHIEAQPERFQQDVPASPDRLTRKVQFVVLANQPNNPSSLQSAKNLWRPLIELTPEDLLNTKAAPWPQKLTESLKRMAQRGRGSALEQPCLGNQARKLVAESAGADQLVLQLDPGGWQAIPISAQPGEGLCLIEIDYAVGSADDHELALGVSLLKPDASSQISPLGQDSGVFLPPPAFPPTTSEDGKTQTDRTHTHRVYHWPTEQTAWLVVANRHAKYAARISAVRVLATPEQITDDSTSAQTPTDASLATRRQAMAFFEAPLFPENFGAREYVDPSIGQPLDDWVTFYQGAQRLIQYLKANGNSGAFITVAADGSSIYPSRLLHPGPRYDNGAFLSSGQDPVRKDVVEMLFRMFQREQLQLVPVLAMNATLPELERRPNSRLVDYSGQMATSGADALLPRYNPLDPSVQRAVTSVVKEFAQRYGGHDNFNRLAIVCRPDTYTLLPGQQWANDAATIGRFIQDTSDLTGIDEIVELESTAQVAALLGRFREPWLAWRAEQMATWYRQIRNTMQAVAPATDLVLAPIDLYRNAETSAALNPALHTSSDFAATMLRMGFDASWGTDDPRNEGITLLNPHRVAPAKSLASRRVDWHVDRSPLAASFFSGVNRGQLFVHRSDWIHFAQLQSLPPMANQQSRLVRSQPLTPGGDAARRRFVEAIRDADSRLLVDGGQALATGQEQTVANLNRVFCQLPNLPFEDVLADTADSSAGATSSLPVVVRQAVFEDESYFYAVNASPWPMQVNCVMSDEPTAGMFKSLSGVAFQRLGERNNARMVISLAPWSLAGGRSTSASTKLASYSVTFPDDADIHLRKQVYRLQSLLGQAAETPPLDGLSNPGFERVGQPEANQQSDQPDLAMPVGWTSNGLAGDRVRLKLDPADAHEGQHAVTLSSNDSQPVWIRSNAFPAPETGRLSVSAWLKTDQPDQPLPLRISLEGSVNKTNYYRFGSIGSLSPSPQLNQVGSQWQRFAVHFDDLPLENLDRLRIGFDLMGPGRVTIDQVLIHDRWFDENDSKAITQLLASASTLLSSPNTYDRARRLLDGYWPRFLVEHFRDTPSETVDAGGMPDRTAAAPPQISDRPTGSPDRSQAALENADGPASGAAEATKQGFMRLRNVFGPREPRVR